MILRALSAFWNSYASPIADHLWQSTLFVALAAILVLALRKNQGRVRYWVWLTASVKFLLPFSLLIALGGHLAKPRVSTPAQAVVYSAVEDFSQPFAGPEMPSIPQAPAPVSRLHLLPPIIVAAWLAGIVVILLVWATGWIRVLLMVRRAVPLREGPEVEALRRLESSFGIRKPIRLVLSRNWMEPGIFGTLRPVLIWPEGISQHLDDRHIEAILAHEICHARRHDNLTAILHMLVEAIFWFHPLVWWMGARLEEERERACDEEVSLLCNQPHVYAESILRVCKFCSESPLACVSGITGANLKKRIVQIMTERVVRKLDLRRKLLLLAAAAAVVAVPLALGMLHTLLAYGQVLYTSGPLPSFEVATIRPMPNGYLPTPTPHGGSIVRLRFTPKMMIMYAYNLPDFSEGRIVNRAGWTDDDYQVEGKISDSDYAAMQKMTPAEKNQQIQLMVQSLLRDRMTLSVHLEKREETIYALEVAKGGAKLTLAKEGLPKEFGVTHQGQVYQFTGNGGNLDGLALQLGRQPEIGGRSVVNKTGITGSYDVKLRWTRTGSAAAAPDDASTQDGNAPSFFTAIQEQLGLRLVTTKGQVDYVVVDHIEKPTVDGAEMTPILSLSPLGDKGAPGSIVAKLGRAVLAQKLSDTGGVDFSSYLQRIQSDVGRNGAPLAPSNASRLSKSGVVAIRLVLLPDGRIGAMKLEQSSGNADLDKAAWYAITSEGTFPPLPSAFHGPQVELLLKFFYNTDVVEPSASLVPVAMAQVNPVPPATATSAPSFEVASVRMVDAHTEAEVQRSGLLTENTYPTTHFFLHNTTLDFLIATAYRVDLPSIQKDAGWMDSQLYDVDAKTPGDRALGREEMRPLLQGLLAQRFHLTLHREHKNVSGYELVVAKDGPKLKAAKAGGETHAQILPNGFDTQSSSMSLLAEILTRSAGEPVVDKTGLAGEYVVRLRYAAANDVNSTLPSIFTAIQEQLGLKLQPAKVPVEYLVVDHAERVPTEN
jgi:bla regulator protein BlaR1